MMHDRRLTRAGCLAAVVLFACMPLVARAQQNDAEGSKDHPAIPRIPGYYIEDYDQVDFDSIDIVINADDKTQRVEGKRWKIAYWLKDGATRRSAVEISRNYRNAFTQKGGAEIYALRDGIHSTFSLKQGGSTVWCAVDVSNSGEIYELTIVETAALNQQVELSVSELARALKEKGSVALHGILFDTGKSTIKPESAETLKTVADVLKADPALMLEIQGHTDNVGAKAANLRLSQERAAAVQAYLVQTHGIAAARLTSAGFGDTRPVANNATEQGRAQNRRVELVRK